MRRRNGKAPIKIIAIVVVVLILGLGAGLGFKYQQDKKALSDFSYTASRLTEQFRYTQSKDQLSALDSQYRQLQMDIASANLCFDKEEGTKIIEDVGNSLTEAKTRLGQ